MTFVELGTLRYRSINALSWRVASELARRDRRVFIGLTGNGGSAAHADALILSGGAQYQARRKGSGFAAGVAGQTTIEWEKAFCMPSARSIAIALEKSIGIHLPEKSPATTPRALGYRVMALVLEMTVGDRQQWHAYEALGGPLDEDTPIKLGRLQDYEGTRWSLYRDNEQLAVLDNFGWLKVGDREIELHKRYRELGGRLYPLVLDVLGDLVP